LAQAFVRANAVRDALLADPRYARVDVDTLVAADTAPAGAPPHGDTVGIAALSADGYALSLIQSVYFGFGACVLDPDTGILFQNRGTSFSLDPCSPNAFAPRKRPRHTLMPVLVTRGDELAWVSSTMGGQGQPQLQAQVLLRSFAGADPQQAVAAPRWIVGHQDTADTERTVTIESDLSAPARTALTDSRLEVKFVAPHSGLLGHANLIRVAADGTVTAGSDPRSDGSSATYQTPSNTPNLRGRSSIDPL
jgi:gamma-glutamyltranspeptidase/glutathione hydrolase